MRFVLIILCSVVLSSCLTVGRIQRNCDKFAAVCVRDTEKVIEYRDTTIYTTDTIYFKIPADTIHIIDTVTILGDMAQMAKIHKTKGVIGVDVWIENSLLGVDAYLKDSTILIPHTDTIRLPGVIKDKVVTKTIQIRHVPLLYKICFWIVLALIVFAAMKLKSKFKLF